MNNQTTPTPTVIRGIPVPDCIDDMIEKLLKANPTTAELAIEVRGVWGLLLGGSHAV